MVGANVQSCQICRRPVRLSLGVSKIGARERCKKPGRLSHVEFNGAASLWVFLLPFTLTRRTSARLFFCPPPRSDLTSASAIRAEPLVARRVKPGSPSARQPLTMNVGTWMYQAMPSCWTASGPPGRSGKPSMSSQITLTPGPEDRAIDSAGIYTTGKRFRRDRRDRCFRVSVRIGCGRSF